MCACLKPCCLQAPSGKEIVVISSVAEEDVGSLVQGMADFAPPGSRVTLVSPETPGELPDALGNCQFRHLQGSVASRQTLLQASQAAPQCVRSFLSLWHIDAATLLSPSLVNRTLGGLSFRFCQAPNTFRQGPNIFRQGPDTFRPGPDTFRPGPDTFRSGSDAFCQGQHTH